ncbi:MAG: DUF1800 domain-containing protein [bacterium]|nr:DUF1800 domain-containing protein [bacterium]
MMPSRSLNRLLQRASFGARPGQSEALATRGAATWLEEQLQPGGISEAGLEKRLRAIADAELEPGDRDAPIGDRTGMSADRASAKKARRERVKRMTRHSAAARIVRAVHGERQLQEVMVDFWANHFSVFARKGPIGALLDDYERRVLRPHALGRFEDLLIAVAQSPAMLFYLDNIRSGVPRKARVSKRAPKGINENYARELLELHTLGVEAGYTQSDIIEAARVLTGWNVQRRGTVSFKFRSFLHDRGDKNVLGDRVPGSGVEQGLWLLRRLARHTSTARHISFKLVRRFVADDPPPALVERTAQTFMETRGDIASLLRTILHSPEFADPANRKLKTPLEFVASALRTTGGETDGGKRLRKELALLGELPFMARTPQGYPDEAQEWIDPSSVLARVSLAFGLGRGLGGTRLGPTLPSTLNAPQSPGLAGAERIALAVASPEFQWQ